MGDSVCRKPLQDLDPVWIKRLDGVVRSMLFEATGKRACTRAGLLKVCLIIRNSEGTLDRKESAGVSKDT